MKIIARNPKYYITDDGRIFTYRRGCACQMKPLFDSHTGYFKIGLWDSKEGRARSFFIHALVSEAYIGERPDGMRIMHVDRNKLNNHITNLRYTTGGACNKNSALPCGKVAVPVILENEKTGIKLQLPTITIAAKFLKCGIPTVWRQATRLREKKPRGGFSTRQGKVGNWKVSFA